MVMLVRMRRCVFMFPMSVCMIVVMAMFIMRMVMIMIVAVAVVSIRMLMIVAVIMRVSAVGIDFMRFAMHRKTARKQGPLLH